jgi:hypothetical protein
MWGTYADNLQEHQTGNGGSGLQPTGPVINHLANSNAHLFVDRKSNCNTWQMQNIQPVLQV